MEHGDHDRDHRGGKCRRAGEAKMDDDQEQAHHGKHKHSGCLLETKLCHHEIGEPGRALDLDLGRPQRVLARDDERVVGRAHLGHVPRSARETEPAALAGREADRAVVLAQDFAFGQLKVFGVGYYSPEQKVQVERKRLDAAEAKKKAEMDLARKALTKAILDRKAADEKARSENMKAENAKADKARAEEMEKRAKSG